MEVTGVLKLRPGNRVAVMPARGAPVEEVVEIATVHYVSRVFVQLGDARIYALHDGRCIGDPMGGYIVPANEAHDKAMEKRRQLDGHYAAIALHDPDDHSQSHSTDAQSSAVENRAVQ
jgi:hypothetical protein